MYTEDDKVSRKKVNNNKSSSFYDEEADFYDSEDTNYNTDDNFYDNVESDTKEDKNIKKIGLIVIGSIVLAIILIILALVIFSSKDDDTIKADIRLLTEKISLKVGEEKHISYEILNTEEMLPVSYKSKNESIATVDKNGKVVGVKEGDTKVVISYKSGKKNQEKECEISVTK